MTGRRTAALTVIGVLLLAACTTDSTEPTRLRIATGSPTAVYYAFGRSLATILNRELPEVAAEVMVTAASAENVALISKGDAELGFTQADILAGGQPYGRKLTAVARVYEDLLHLVTLADGPIHRLADLRGQRVAIGAEGSGTAVTVKRLLMAAGLGEQAVQQHRLGIDDSVTALRTGKIDAFFFSGGLPVRAVADLVTQTGGRFIDLGDLVEPLRRAYGEVYVGRDIPRSAYGVDEVRTVAVPNYLVVLATMPEHLVYEVTRLLMQRRDELGGAHPAAARLNTQSAIATAPLDLHPGAARYYQSHKP